MLFSLPISGIFDLAPSSISTGFNGDGDFNHLTVGGRVEGGVGYGDAFMFDLSLFDSDPSFDWVVHRIGGFGTLKLGARASGCGFYSRVRWRSMPASLWDDDYALSSIGWLSLSPLVVVAACWLELLLGFEYGPGFLGLELGLAFNPFWLDRDFDSSYSGSNLVVESSARLVVLGLVMLPVTSAGSPSKNLPCTAVQEDGMIS